MVSQHLVGVQKILVSIPSIAKIISVKNTGPAFSSAELTLMWCPLSHVEGWPCAVSPHLGIPMSKMPFQLPEKQEVHFEGLHQAF